MWLSQEVWTKLNFLYVEIGLGRFVLFDKYKKLVCTQQKQTGKQANTLRHNTSEKNQNFTGHQTMTNYCYHKHTQTKQPIRTRITL